MFVVCRQDIVILNCLLNASHEIAHSIRWKDRHVHLWNTRDSNVGTVFSALQKMAIGNVRNLQFLVLNGPFSFFENCKTTSKKLT